MYVNNGVCAVRDTINVMFSPPIQVNLGEDTTICQGSEITLSVNFPNTNYQWQDGSTASTYTVTLQGTYWINVIDKYNCPNYDTIKVTYKDCDTLNIIIPNVFTPNNDGYNDNFVIKQTEYKNIELQIYNRWGTKVFEDNNYQNTWNGTYNGNLLPDGTYFYIIKTNGIYNKKEKEYHGSLTILR